MRVKKIGIVSLSSGILGENFVSHQLNLGLERLKNYGLQVEFMPNALKGIEYLKENPKARADDLCAAFADESIDMILCSIGGEDTYRLLPYLFDNQQLMKSVKQKIFLGFSDTTINHFMLHKLGIQTFYGQAFLTDICELSNEMLPYSKQFFEELLFTGKIKEIYPSDIWYEERHDFSERAKGVELPSYQNNGYELLQGKSRFEGKILGGCLESIFMLLDNSRYSDSVFLSQKYQLFPSIDEWRGKILLIETSEEKPEPKLFQRMIESLQDTGIFEVLSGMLVGKPQNEMYYENYKTILLDTIKNKSLPIVYNINIGHATPRAIIPFGVHAEVNVAKQVIRFERG